MNEVKLPFNARLTFTLLSILLIIYIARLGHELIVPLIFALLVSIMLLPIANQLEKWRFSRGAAALTVILLFVIVLSGVLMLLISQMGSFVADFPQLQEQLLKSLNSLQVWINAHFHINSTKQMDYLEQLAMGTLGSATTFLSTTLFSVSSLLIFVVFVLLYSFFLLLYRRLLVTFLIRVFLDKHREKVQDVIIQTRYIIKGYVTGLMIEMIVVAIVNCTIFWILGIKYATLLGIVAAIFNIIPYLGIYIATILCMILTLTNSSVGTTFQVGIGLLVVHFLDSNILLPRIVGSKVKINALVTILGVVAGNLIWGVPGMFLAIPIIAILKIVFEHIEYMQPWALLLGDVTFKKKKLETKKDPDVVSQ
ncbi:Predicted PurR-regulated permease PerM [Chitinophaga sp. CF118]|uniref:AI-2E family transporter n=1 Tax=Chitinophaga sp. CF118 TaxID=1884367 RepID=UPI0008E422FC|nr:AI-2E family transporter [Chitinophaga sp. CF118]SFD85302.1 Predicted PurR-regulated permease PerM [Chitinophaga sp. CF118]